MSLVVLLIFTLLVIYLRHFINALICMTLIHIINFIFSMKIKKGIFAKGSKSSGFFLYYVW